MLNGVGCVEQSSGASITTGTAARAVKPARLVPVRPRSDDDAVGIVGCGHIGTVIRSLALVKRVWWTQR
jgi:hypothetical protein